MSANEAIAVIGFFIGLGTTLASVLAWYSSSVKKRYAAERDFNHLRNNLAQHQQEIIHLREEMEEGFSQIKLQLIEIKAYLIRYAGESTTGGKL